MNANELADELENIHWMQGDGKVKPFQHYADFVRQQQAEIEALKAQVLAWENADVPTEVMAEIIIELEKRGFIEKTEKAQEKCPPASWWKGDPTCGGLTENYGLGKAQKK